MSALLACGIASSLLYVAADVLASIRWAGYSYVNQAVSELSAIGAPTRPLIVGLFSAYDLLVIVFAVGVWVAVAGRRSLRVSAAMLGVYALVGQATLLFSPMHLRGTEVSGTDIGHMLLTAAEVLSIVLFMAFGSGAGGRRFRVYSIATIVVLVAAGALTGALSTHMTAAASSTPWAGIVERVNIYGTMLWVALFALVLMRGDRERAEVTGAAPHAKKVTAFVGSAHKSGATYSAARRFLDDLEAFGDVEGEIVVLSDYDVGICRGCKACFKRGEEHCPLKDDRDVLIGKMRASDAVVFASPNYSFQVSGFMKVFLDRLGFAFHRPRFHGKTATSIVVQGIYGGGKVAKYLDFAAGGLGFNVVKGGVLRTLEPMTEAAVRKRDRTLAEQSRRFHEHLLRPAYPVPSLLALALFRMSRTSIGLMLGDDDRDHTYYREQGWFESDYYYPTRLGPLKKAVGAVVDWVAGRAFGGGGRERSTAIAGPAPQ